MDDSSITYRSAQALGSTLILTYTDDGVDFTAIGFAPSDELLVTAAKAEGLTYELDGLTWVCDWS